MANAARDLAGADVGAHFVVGRNKRGRARLMGPAAKALGAGANEQEVLAGGRGRSAYGRFCAISLPIWVSPIAETRNGMPICAALMTISRSRRPVV